MSTGAGQPKPAARNPKPEHERTKWSDASFCNPRAGSAIVPRMGTANISIVIPVYNEKDTLEPLAEAIAEHSGDYTCRIVFVDDGSTDGSGEVLGRLAARNPAVSVRRHRRNLGKSAALATGFECAEGDIILIMDADLQDDPKEIPRFVAKIQEGYDVVCGWKADRKDPLDKTLPSKAYNWGVARLFGLPLHDINCGFKAFRSDVLKEIAVYGELHRLLPVLAAHRGFTITEIPVEHHPRRFGRSKYGMERILRGAADVLSLWFVTRYGESPAHFFALLAALVLAVGVAGGVVAAVLSHTMTLIVLAGVGAMCAALSALLLVCIGLVAELVLWERRAKRRES